MKKIKKKIIFYKCLFIEIVETLCSICLYLDRMSRSDRYIFRSHFNALKGYSEKMRYEIISKEHK